MYTRCPGQDSRNLRVKLYKCPKCGAGVEIFSDEVKVKCRKCGEEPGCKYVAKHRHVIEQYMKNR